MESHSVKLFIYRCVDKYKKKRKKKTTSVFRKMRWCISPRITPPPAAAKEKTKNYSASVSDFSSCQAGLEMGLWWRSKVAQLDSLDPCLFTLGKKIKIKIQHQVEMWESFFTGRIKATINHNAPPSLPPPCILHYLHLSTVLDPWPLWHHTDWVFSMITREQGNIKTSNTGDGAFSVPSVKKQRGFFFLNPWGVKQQNSRSFFVTVAVSLAWSSAATQRWTLERDIHKNMPIFL